MQRIGSRLRSSGLLGMARVALWCAIALGRDALDVLDGRETCIFRRAMEYPICNCSGDVQGKGFSPARAAGRDTIASAIVSKLSVSLLFGSLFCTSSSREPNSGLMESRSCYRLCVFASDFICACF